MVDVVRKLKPAPVIEEPRQTIQIVDMSPVVSAINDQTLALVETLQAGLEQKQPSRRWVFKIVRDGAGDLKQVVAECE